MKNIRILFLFLFCLLVDENLRNLFEYFNLNLSKGWNGLGLDGGFYKWWWVLDWVSKIFEYLNVS